LANEPPSLAARLDHDGPLPWREAARLTARIARALDRRHAQGKAHGGIEPLTILFVGGTVRLADPLPPAHRSPAFQAPAVRAGEPPDRQADFFSLGQTMAAMLAGDQHDPAAAPALPPPLAAVQRRLVEGDPLAGYGSGNDVAAALELAIAASEGFADQPAAPPPTPDPRALPPGLAATAPPLDPGRPDNRPRAHKASVDRRQRPPALVLVVACLLLLAGLAVVLLWPEAERVAEIPPQPAQITVPGQEETASAPVEPAAGEPSPEAPAVVAPITLAEVLAALPEVPLGPPPARPETKAQVQALMAELETWPCSRLEVEPSPLGLRLVGSTGSASDRSALLAAIRQLDDVDRVLIRLDREGAWCQLYDLLASRTASAVPRLADLFPPRADYRLVAAEPLIVRVLTPDFPSHVKIDYFTADGMVVHLARAEAGRDPVEPRSELRVGDPADGHLLTIAEPFGRELILVIASRAPLFAEARPRIEPAETYLEALAAALAAQAEPPMASTMAIETVPATP
jgi:hypothetical protein